MALSTASALAPAVSAAAVAPVAALLRLRRPRRWPACAACAGRLRLLIDFGDRAFVLARALLRLLERAAERVDLVVHFADAGPDELLRRAGRRAADGEHGNRNCHEEFPQLIDPPRSRIRARLPRDITTPGSNGQVLVARTDHERMPARLAARFERDEVLMPQLVDDLPRRDAALRRRARHEHVSAGPGGEIARAGRRAPTARRSSSSCPPTGCRSTARCRRCRPARRSRWRSPTPRAGVSRLALSWPSVSTTTARRRPSRVADALGRLRDRVVQRRRAERHDAAQRVRQRLQARRERRDLFELRVEREDRRLRRAPRRASSGRASPLRARAPAALPCCR